MNILSRPAYIAAAILLVAPALTPRYSWAQTPAQMEYERQQREYRQQLERQREQQQQQQQLMNENAFDSGGVEALKLPRAKALRPTTTRSREGAQQPGPARTQRLPQRRRSG